MVIRDSGLLFLGNPISGEPIVLHLWSYLSQYKVFKIFLCVKISVLQI